MTYEQWEADVPACMREDVLWKVEAYRLALFGADLAYTDCASLRRDERSRALISQLIRAAGSIHSNIAEGYSRNTGVERGRFYEFAQGSAREARGWYFTCRRQFKPSVVEHRLALFTSLVKLTTKMTVGERRARTVVIPRPRRMNSDVKQQVTSNK